MLTSQARFVRALDGQRALSCLHHPTEDSRDHQRQVLLVHSHRWHWASGFQVHGHQLPVGILGWADPLLKSQTSHGRSLTNPSKTLPYKQNPEKSLKQSQCLHLNPCDPIKKHQKTATISTQPHYIQVTGSSKISSTALLGRAVSSTKRGTGRAWSSETPTTPAVSACVTRPTQRAKASSRTCRRETSCFCSDSVCLNLGMCKN